MISKKILSRQCFYTANRFFATQLINQDPQSAKSFESIPKLTVLNVLTGFAPGGQFYGMEFQEFHTILHEKYGGIVKFPAIFGRPSTLFSYHAEDFEKVFRNEGIWPFRRMVETLTYYRKEKRPDIYKDNVGLISSNGKEWQDMRTIVNPIMMQPKNAKLYCSQVDEIAKEFVQLIKTLRDNNNEMPADFQNHINMWSLESICAVALEHRLHILGGGTKDKKAEELIKCIRIFLEKIYVYDGLPSIWKYYETKKFKEFLKNYDRMTNIIIHYIDEAIEEYKSKPSNDNYEDGILRKLIKVDKKAAIVMASDMLLAGVDTTAVGVTNILYSLAKNPEKQKLLQDEIIKILPDKNSKLSVENMKNLPYLRAVIKETFRMMPIASGTSRKLQTDTVLSGFKIPSGTEVMMPVHFETMNPKQYPQPEKFIPERWVRENSDPSCPHSKTANPFAFLPFGFGSRMCIGKRIADLEMEIVIANIVRNYKIEWHHPDIKIKNLFVNIPISDLKFKFIDSH